MSVEIELADEILDTPTMAAASCAQCFVCVCVGITEDATEALEVISNTPRLDRADLSDEVLDTPTMAAASCAQCFVCVCVGIDDEALEAPAAR